MQAVCPFQTLSNLCVVARTEGNGAYHLEGGSACLLGRASFMNGLKSLSNLKRASMRVCLSGSSNILLVHTEVGGRSCGFFLRWRAFFHARAQASRRSRKRLFAGGMGVSGMGHVASQNQSHPKTILSCWCAQKGRNPASASDHLAIELAASSCFCFHVCLCLRFAEKLSLPEMSGQVMVARWRQTAACSCLEP